jgi:nucleotide-binding universal stress UspA family protein
MNKILVPTDFSDNAYNALEYAINLSKKTGAEILVFNAFHMPASNTNVMIDISDVLKEGVEENLKTLTTKVAQQYPEIELETKCAYGLPDMMIPTVAKEEKVDLVVMGTKGESGLKTALFGSVTIHSIQHSTIPLLVVPENAKFSDFKEIVLAADYITEEKQMKLDVLRELTTTFGANIDVVSVLKDLSTAPLLDGADEESANQTFAGLKASYTYVENSSIEEGINDFAASNNADMLVMIAHNYNWLKKIFHRSVTKKMVLHSKTPLLIIQE